MDLKTQIAEELERVQGERAPQYRDDEAGRQIKLAHKTADLKFLLGVVEKGQQPEELVAEAFAEVKDRA